MRSTLGTLLAAALLATTAAAATANEPEWIKQFGTTSDDYAFGVATGADGTVYDSNVYMVGNTWGALGGANKGRADAFVITFDREGGELWRRQPGTTGLDRATGVATDADGNVYVVGYTEGAFGGTAKGNGDAFVIKFDRDGRTVWKRQPGTSEGEYAYGVATDADGNVYVVGHTEGALGGAQKGAMDAFVIKYDRDGRIVWKRQPGSNSYDLALDVATDADGNVYMVGDTYGALGGTDKGNGDAFVIKYDRDGRIVWKRQPGTSEGEGGYGVATDADGNVYMVGYTLGVLGGTAKGDSDALVIKYDRDGRIVWKRQPGTTSNDYASAVATDGGGNVYVAGFTRGPLGGANKGEGDAFVIKYDRDGRIVWKRQPGTTDEDGAQAVATDADGNVYMVGETEGALGGANEGGDDAFVIKYGPDGSR